MDTLPDTCKHQYFLFTYLHKSGGTNLTLLAEKIKTHLYSGLQTTKFHGPRQAI